MSTGFTIRTLIEFFVILLIIVGLIYEDKVIWFEDQIHRIVVGNYRRYKRVRAKKHK